MIDSPARTPERQAVFNSPAGLLWEEVAHDEVKFHTTTHWKNVWLLVQFLCGILDYFFYEDEEYVLKGFRNPETHVVYLTYIGEKKRDA